MSLTERTIAAAIALGGVAVAPQPIAKPRAYYWTVAQDAGAPGAPDASAGDAGMTPEQREAEIQRAIRAFKDAANGRKETSQ